MAASNEDSRIVVPFKPTLSHMSLSKLAVRLYNEFGFETLKKALTKMESGHLAKFEVYSPENCSLLRNRVKENLLIIPTNLRRRVLGAVKGVEIEVSQWKHHHKHIDHAKCPLFWRSDGTIDRIKTAQEICRNQNVYITTRFEIACEYFLANEVQTLWVALRSNLNRKNYEINLIPGRVRVVKRFWVRWMHERAKVPWIQAAEEHLSEVSKCNGSILSSLFRVFTPEKRRNFLGCIGLCEMDDLRLCLYTMTKEEQEQTMETLAPKVLELHMNWPLASHFLETSGKSWKFLNCISFCSVLESLLDRKDRTDFDFEYLAEEFWERSPNIFKEKAKECDVFRKVHKFIEERSMKRKLDNDDRASPKRFRESP